MSYSNMNMLIDMIGTTEYRNQVTAFGNWTGVGLVIFDAANPESPRYSVIPIYGPVLPTELIP